MRRPRTDTPRISAARLALAAGLAAALAACTSAQGRACRCGQTGAGPWPVPCAWLRAIETPATAEARHTVAGVALGALHDEWLALVAAMRPGDDLWFYSGTRPCPPGSSCFHPGEDGYLLVRNCRVVKQLVLAYTFAR